MSSTSACSYVPRLDLPVTVPPTRPIGRDMLDAVVNAFETGIVVCDDRGYPYFMNSTAEHQIADSPFLRLNAGRLCGARDMGALAAGIAAACVRGTRRMVPLKTENARMHVAISPVQGTNGDRAALVLLGSRGSCSELSIELLGISEGLTAAERQVLLELVARRAPIQISQERAVTLSTVRTQIAAIYSKLSVRTQQELLCVVGSAPSLSYQCGRSYHVASLPSRKWG